MSKTPSHKLFKLIKSLSGSEKRYFKIFVHNEKSETSKYLQLFDAIEQQDIYDDSYLQNLIYPNEPIQSRKFSELKSYLYDLILKSLQGFDEKSSVDYKLKGMLQNVRVLYKRSHYEDCKEMLLKAKKIAYKFEAFVSILEVLRWEKQIAYAEINVAFLDKELVRIDEEEKECLKKLRNLTNYRNIFFKLLIDTNKKGFLRNKEQVKLLEAIMKNPLLKDNKLALSHQAEVLFHRIYGFYNYSTMNYKAFYESNKKIMEVMEAEPHLLKEDVSEYISALSNLVVSCGLLEKYNEIPICLEKFHSIKPNTYDDKFKIHRHYYSHKISLCIFTGEFDEGLKTLEQHLKEARKFDKELFENNSFYFQYFYFYFGTGNYTKSLEYLNEWLNLPKSIERPDMQSLARILNLLVHYEMGNMILLESLLRSTYRFQRKQNRLYEFERIILSFMKEAIKIQSKKKLKSSFIALKTDFEALAKIPEENIMLKYFDFMAWLDSKINEKSYAEVVQEKYRKYQTSTSA